MVSIGRRADCARAATLIDVSDLDPDEIWFWSAPQLARAWPSKFLRRLPPAFWDSLAEAASHQGREE